jgi:hypothetical protein
MKGKGRNRDLGVGTLSPRAPAIKHASQGLQHCRGAAVASWSRRVLAAHPRTGRGTTAGLPHAREHGGCRHTVLLLPAACLRFPHCPPLGRLLQPVQLRQRHIWLLVRRSRLQQQAHQPPCTSPALGGLAAAKHTSNAVCQARCADGAATAGKQDQAAEQGYGAQQGGGRGVAAWPAPATRFFWATGGLQATDAGKPLWSQAQVSENVLDAIGGCMYVWRRTGLTSQARQTGHGRAGWRGSPELEATTAQLDRPTV